MEYRFVKMPGRYRTIPAKSLSDWCSWAQIKQPSRWTASHRRRYQANPLAL